MSRRVLVVEDDRSAAEYLRLLLDEEGCEPEVAANGVEALLRLEAQTFQAVFTDLRMPELDGLGLLARLKQRWPELPVVVLTASDDVASVVEAVQLGALAYLVKPAPRHAVVGALRQALRAAPPAGAAAVPAASEIVGTTRAVVEVRHLVARAARSDVPVLITGETGTGKELVARAIHRGSGRASGPFVAHNCAIAPRELFESELFGHRRGAFTGADRDHTGLLVRAHEGVLLLDELETLAPEHQAQLLRVMDDGEVRPVGAEVSRPVSVRYLAATNRDPQTMLRERTLRDDLYYRIRGFEIALPALRERREDVPLLASHFLDEAGGGDLSPAALDLLVAAPWPGNVRQLRNAVLAARASAGTALITPRHLPPDLATAPAPAVDPATLRDAERGAITRALATTRGNRTRAAALLGINRSTLRRKLKQLGIEG